MMLSPFRRNVIVITLKLGEPGLTAQAAQHANFSLGESGRAGEVAIFRRARCFDLLDLRPISVESL
jgi:hypothetical protein